MARVEAAPLSYQAFFRPAVTHKWVASEDPELLEPLPQAADLVDMGYITDLSPLLAEQIRQEDETPYSLGTWTVLGHLAKEEGIENLEQCVKYVAPDYNLRKQPRIGKTGTELAAKWGEWLLENYDFSHADAIKELQLARRILKQTAKYQDEENRLQPGGSLQAGEIAQLKILDQLTFSAIGHLQYEVAKTVGKHHLGLTQSERQERDRERERQMYEMQLRGQTETDARVKAKEEERLRFHLTQADWQMAQAKRQVAHPPQKAVERAVEAVVQRQLLEIVSQQFAGGMETVERLGLTKRQKALQILLLATIVGGGLVVPAMGWLVDRLLDTDLPPIDVFTSESPEVTEDLERRALATITAESADTSNYGEANSGVEEGVTTDVVVTNEPIIDESDSSSESSVNKADHIIEFIFGDLLARFIDIRLMEYASFTPEEKTEWRAAVGSEAQLRSKFICVALLGIDAGTPRDDTLDALWGLPRQNHGQADQIQVLCLNPESGDVIIISVPRDLRVPELKYPGMPLAYTANSSIYFDHRVNQEPENPTFYDTEVIRKMLRDATGMNIDAVIKCNWDCMVDSLNAIFQRGIRLTIPEHLAFTSDVLIRQAYGPEFLAWAVTDPGFVERIFARASEADQAAFKAAYPEASLEQKAQFVLNQRVRYPTGEDTYLAEEVLFFVRTRQLAHPEVERCQAGSSALERDKALQVVLMQVVGQLKDRLESPNLYHELNGLLNSLINAFQGDEKRKGLEVESPHPRRDSERSDLSVTWGLTAEVQVEGRLDGEQVKRTVRVPYTLANYLTFFRDQLNAILEVNDLDTSRQAGALFLKGGLPFKFWLVGLSADELEGDNGKLRISGNDPHRAETLADVINYWQPLRDKVAAAVAGTLAPETPECVK